MKAHIPNISTLTLADIAEDISLPDIPRVRKAVKDLIAQGRFKLVDYVDIETIGNMYMLL